MTNLRKYKEFSSFRIILIIASDETTKVTGGYQKQVDSGIAVFDDLTFSAPPGSKNVSFTITSSSIHTEEIYKNFNTTDPLINLDYVYFNFRECEPGEASISGEYVYF